MHSLCTNEGRVLNDVLMLCTNDHVLNVKNSEGDKNCPVFRLCSLLAIFQFSVNTHVDIPVTIIPLLN